MLQTLQCIDAHSLTKCIAVSSIQVQITREKPSLADVAWHETLAHCSEWSCSRCLIRTPSSPLVKTGQGLFLYGLLYLVGIYFNEAQINPLTSLAERVIGVSPVAGILHELGTDTVHATRCQLAPMLVSRSRYRQHPDNPTEPNASPKHYSACRVKRGLFRFTM